MLISFQQYDCERLLDLILSACSTAAFLDQSDFLVK